MPLVDSSWGAGVRGFPFAQVIVDFEGLTFDVVQGGFGVLKLFG